jgi:hypothetical protein
VSDNLEARFRIKLVESLQRDVFVEYVSSSTRGGIPDLHMVWSPEGTAVWAELKAVHAPEETAKSKRASSYGFTALQRSWLERVKDAGGIGLGIVGMKNSSGRWEAVVLDAYELPSGGLSWSDLDGRPRLLIAKGLYAELRKQVLGT